MNESSVAPRRIVCLTDETVEVLYLLGEQQRIVGVSGFAAGRTVPEREYGSGL
jgi:iron complex transport system substrate-binding protein